MSDFFKGLSKVEYEGPDSDNPLAFHHYNPDEIVMGKRMEEHLRFAVAYWHSFAWEGGDPFGGRTFERPWFDDGMDGARLKADVAFELFSLLGAPYFCFHDADVRPESESFAKSKKRLEALADIFEQKIAETGVKLLWGTANLFSNRRFMGGAATNPDPDVFAYAGATIKANMDVTHRLGGENYVLWGGREGYETLLNTNLGQEMDQMARMLSMVVDYKHKIGFSGAILIEPKPQEPTKHQYDFDSETVIGFLRHHGLDKDFKLNIETSHATLAQHTMDHEMQAAANAGMLGSIDANRGDYQNSWDTDQFPYNINETVEMMLVLLRHGGFQGGGVNFDAKRRRNSTDLNDTFFGHIGGMDVFARSLLIADDLIQKSPLEKMRAERYASFDNGKGADFEQGKLSLEQLAEIGNALGEPKQTSGQQELYENIINRFVR
ncbi:xylose isomerase [Marinimicrobium sp. UBA4209]|uniref:xylose isomerase n=1 Tax=Marinimicrobium sp. UBA4209 TaxID=1946810 RepID=UPI00257CEB2C|nr:xylose isomerase [Marinimicrobium sp. UBA4209]